MDWSKIDKVSVFTGKDENGNRYLNTFLRDYALAFNLKPEEINAGCNRCLDDYYTKLIKFQNVMSTQTKSVYQLKPKYNGIALKFGSQERAFNSTLTDKQAETLLKEHPKGKDLFAVFPAEKKITLESLKEDYTRAEMNAYAKTLGIENAEEAENKTSLAQAILEL